MITRNLSQYIHSSHIQDRMISIVWDSTVNLQICIVPNIKFCDGFLLSILLEDDCNYIQFVYIFNQTKLDGFCFVDNSNNDKNVVAIQLDKKR